MTRLTVLLVAAICFGFGACSGGDSQKVDVDAALDNITIENLQAHHAYLADDARAGRMTGQPGYDDAARYVAEQFKALGLEPGGNDGWYQQVPFISYRYDTETTEVFAHRDGKDTRYVFRDDYGATGDALRPENKVRAEVVYVGFGVHAPDLDYSDYDGIDVEGKIIALFSGAPPVFPHNERAFYSSTRTKYQEAAKRGAVGVIKLRGRRSQKNVPWERYKKLTGTLPSMVWVGTSGDAADYYPEIEATVTFSAASATQLFSGTPISFDEAIETTEASKPASTPLGFEVSLARQTTHENIESPNVIGIVRGSDPGLADEYIAYSAHLDHVGEGVEEDGDGVYNGAYDNAMGVALMLETARAFAKHPPRRSVLFIAVTGEERGLLGSDYFAHYPTVPINSIVSNVNLDMPLFLFPPADLVAFGSEHSSMDVIVEAAANAEGFELSPDPVPEETLFVRSDQYSFVRKGVPSIFLVSGFNSTDPEVDGKALFEDFVMNHYHRPSDDLSLSVHWESARRFTRANMRIGTIIGNADERPAWKENDFFGERFALH